MNKIARTAVRVFGNNFLILEYEVPLSMTGVIDAGWRVLAPVKNKLCEGLVLGLEENFGNRNLKQLKEVVDNEPLVDKQMIELASWISEYYMVPLENTLGLIFPPYVKGRWLTYYEVVVSPEQLRSLTTFYPEMADLLEYISKKGFFSKSTVARKFNRHLVETCLARLFDSGYLKEKWEYKDEADFRQGKNMVALTLDEPEVKEFILKNKRASKQIKIIKFLQKAGGMALIEDVLQNVGAAYSTLKALEEKGAVTIRGGLEVGIFPSSTSREIKLSREQEICIDTLKRAISEGTYRSFLLHGITGSGKTEVYLHAAKAVVERGRQVIVIVPEIVLTSQIIKHFCRFFAGRMVVLHSKLSDGERNQAWKLAKRGKVDVVIGTRSAVFAPVPDVGLIIIDEEHEKNLKQENSPRYHTREVAAKRCEMNNAVLVLGTATPSLETFYRTKKGDIMELSMTKRVAGLKLPAICIVDMREELRRGNTSILSHVLQEKIEKRLEKGEQVIAFLNRRAYATFVQCRQCGLALKCRHCDVTLKYHSTSNILKCHYCGYTIPVPRECPQCHSLKVRAYGLGTQKVEEVLKRRFRGVRVLRMDTDTTSRKGAHKKILDSFAEGKFDILVGTQMIAKGLDFPNVTLVSVVAADMGLNLPDFRAGEHTFHLIAQVAGRAGRGKKGGEVIVQTFNPENPSIAFLKGYNFNEFYMSELARRRDLNYPPYTYLIRLLFTSTIEARVIQASTVIADELFSLGFSFMGPAPAPVEKVKDFFRWHIIIRCLNPELKGEILKVIQRHQQEMRAGKINITIDVDPLSLL